MSFGLMSAQSTSHRGVMTIFVEFLNNFMKVFLDNFNIYGTRRIISNTLNFVFNDIENVD